ncbi:hypothetical protein NX801_01970 [Streptomyces sp. LP05-1]|uniref:YoaR-like putative peptidoglycan binding domain-containing protein n=2 Tax=Streptomyces pyxinae TaxID=2970734 RepID=A0ABT2CAL5_9ACTN|nr:hypothetical protein [Streptomyces sp. LP05-1]MCS0634451.1 hypothetical protein [Streptomyces sp. LP05-1]
MTAQPDEPRTETTLTTRIRINIPGSRPIPPVVMRTPMSDVDAGPGTPTGPDAEPSASAAGGNVRTDRADRPGRPDAGRPDGAARTDAAPERPAPERAAEARPAEEKPTSDWFAPRKPVAATPPPAAPGGTDGAGFTLPADGPGAPAPAGPGAGPDGLGLPDGSGQGGPAGPVGMPYFSDAPGGAGQDGHTPEEPGDGHREPLPVRPTGSRGPAGRTTGPMTGNSTVGTNLFGAGAPLDGGTPAGAQHDGAPLDGLPEPAPGYDDPEATSAFNPLPQVPPPGTPAHGTPAFGSPGFDTAGFDMPGGTGPSAGGDGTGPWRADDTAVLTPQQPAPGPGRSGPAGPAGPRGGGRGPAGGRPKGGGGQVSGDTLTSGIPVVPAADRTPPALRDPAPGRPGGPGRSPSAGAPAPAPKAPASSSSPGAPGRAPKKKGRSKLVLLAAGVVGLAGVAYGAGLLLNHSDVPKGTTVLGLDIGGGTKEEAVAKMRTAFGQRAGSPLKLDVGGRTAELDPAKAGLSLDNEETVRAAAGSDYNPVSVIGSLFGGERVAEPVVPVDEEKLSAALNDLAGVSGSANDGTIVFKPGKAVAVPGKAGSGLDVKQSVAAVRDAYRTQVETGKAGPVKLPVTTRQPSVDQAELDRAMKEFAEPAMSGLVTIKAGGKQIQFGPNRSLPQILSMKPVDGKLVPVFDKKAITDLLEGTFNGVMITKGDGQKHPVGADDVAHALQTALLGKTPAERTETIALDGEG